MADYIVEKPVADKQKSENKKHVKYQHLRDNQAGRYLLTENDNIVLIDQIDKAGTKSKNMFVQVPNYSYEKSNDLVAATHISTKNASGEIVYYELIDKNRVDINGVWCYRARSGSELVYIPTTAELYNRKIEFKKIVVSNAENSEYVKQRFIINFEHANYGIDENGNIVQVPDKNIFIEQKIGSVSKKFYRSSVGTFVCEDDLKFQQKSPKPEVEKYISSLPADIATHGRNLDGKFVKVSNKKLKIDNKHGEYFFADDGTIVPKAELQYAENEHELLDFAEIDYDTLYTQVGDKFEKIKSNGPVDYCPVGPVTENEDGEYYKDENGNYVHIDSVNLVCSRILIGDEYDENQEVFYSDGERDIPESEPLYYIKKFEFEGIAENGSKVTKTKDELKAMFVPKVMSEIEFDYKFKTENMSESILRAEISGNNYSFIVSGPSEDTYEVDNSIYKAGYCFAGVAEDGTKATISAEELKVLVVPYQILEEEFNKFPCDYAPFNTPGKINVNYKGKYYTFSVDRTFVEKASTKFVKCIDNSFHDINEMNCQIDEFGKVISTSITDKSKFNGRVENGQILFLTDDISKRYFVQLDPSVSKNYYYKLPDGSFKSILDKNKKARVFTNAKKGGDYYFDGKKYVRVFKDKQYSITTDILAENYARDRLANRILEKRGGFANLIGNAKQNDKFINKHILKRSTKMATRMLEGALSAGPFALVLMPILLTASITTATLGLTSTAILKIANLVPNVVQKLAVRAKKVKTDEEYNQEIALENAKTTENKKSKQFKLDLANTSDIANTINIANNTALSTDEERLRSADAMAKSLEMLAKLNRAKNDYENFVFGKDNHADLWRIKAGIVDDQLRNKTIQQLKNEKQQGKFAKEIGKTEESIDEIDELIKTTTEKIEIKKLSKKKDHLLQHKAKITQRSVALDAKQTKIKQSLNEYEKHIQTLKNNMNKGYIPEESVGVTKNFQVGKDVGVDNYADLTSEGTITSVKNYTDLVSCLKANSQLKTAEHEANVAEINGSSEKTKAKLIKKAEKVKQEYQKRFDETFGDLKETIDVKDLQKKIDEETKNMHIGKYDWDITTLSNTLASEQAKYKERESAISIELKKSIEEQAKAEKALEESKLAHQNAVEQIESARDIRIVKQGEIAKQIEMDKAKIEEAKQLIQTCEIERDELIEANKKSNERKQNIAISNITKASAIQSGINNLFDANNKNNTEHAIKGAQNTYKIGKDAYAIANIENKKIRRLQKQIDALNQNLIRYDEEYKSYDEAIVQAERIERRAKQMNEFNEKTLHLVTRSFEDFETRHNMAQTRLSQLNSITNFIEEQKQSLNKDNLLEEIAQENDSDVVSTNSGTVEVGEPIEASGTNTETKPEVSDTVEPSEEVVEDDTAKGKKPDTENSSEEDGITR